MLLAFLCLLPSVYICAPPYVRFIVGGLKHSKQPFSKFEALKKSLKAYISCRSIHMRAHVMVYCCVFLIHALLKLNVYICEVYFSLINLSEMKRWSTCTNCTPQMSKIATMPYTPLLLAVV